MWFVHLGMAFLPSLTIWLIGSWAVATFVFRAETKAPTLVGNSGWKAFETALVSSVFFGSVAIWIGLTMLLEWSAG